MSIGDLIIFGLILLAVFIIVFMLKEIWKWDRIVITARKLLYYAVIFFIVIIVLGKAIFNTFIKTVFNVIVSPLFIFFLVIIVIVAYFYLGKFINQM